MLAREAAQFLAQRTRLAAQCRQRTYSPGSNLVSATETGGELYIVRSSTVEVWSDPESLPGQISDNLRCMTTMKPGQIVGEFSMLDEGLRSADLIAGSDGATILALTRERLLALCEDDA